MTTSATKTILWTAHEVPLPKVLWNRLEESGYRVVLADPGPGTREKIQKTVPRLWVGQVDGDPEGEFAAIEEIRVGHPDLPIILLSKRPTVQDAVRAIRAGVADYIPDGIPPERLWASIEGALRYSPPLPASEPRRSEKGHVGDLPIAVDPAMRRVVELARRIAPSRATILIQGESGTGKEVLARFIHRSSGRKAGPFVAVNCAALPENLLESELFGHEKGAFTGAIARKKGKFELANAGTLLLDEISEMDVSVQAKLLRVLQEREIDRVGGECAVPVDTRVIATTNRDLDVETKKGNFRLDLFYRLNVVPLHLPPLRARQGDILPLATHLLRTHCSLNGMPEKRLAPEAEGYLQGKRWPGNVRELENLMERAVLLIEPETIRPSDLEEVGIHEEQGDAEGWDEGRVMPLRDMEKRMIWQALRDHKGNRTHAAEVLGISVRTLRNKLHEYQQETGHENSIPGSEVEESSNN